MKSNYHFKFEDLKVYQKAMDFGELVDAMVRNFPNHELYALSSQFRRAADSVALNIAGGVILVQMLNLLNIWIMRFTARMNVWDAAQKQKEDFILILKKMKRIED